MRRRRGFTLIELIVVVCLAGVLMAVVLERLAVYQEMAEKTHMEHTAAVLRSALSLKAAALMATGRFADIASLRDDNPMDWLSDRPSSYVGELYDPKPGEVTPGSWYFDRKSRELAYLPRVARYLDSGIDGRREVRFRAIVRIDDTPVPSGGTRREVSALTVAPTRPYRWSPAF